MDSKRSPLEGTNTLYKDTMSMVMIGVKRSGSNNPIEEITMSTTGSKSSEVEAMGDNATPPPQYPLLVGLLQLQQ
jgi:hypothetical protein